MSPSIDPGQFKSLHKFQAPGVLLALALDRAQPRAFAAGAERVVYVFDLEAKEKKPAATWEKHANWVAGMCSVTPGDKFQLVSGSYDRTLVWWDVEAGTAIREQPAHEGWVRDVLAFPDGQRFATCGDDMLVKLWDAASGACLRTLSGHATTTPQTHVTALYTLAISPDGKFIAAGDRVGDVRIWNVETGELAGNFQVPELYTYDERQRKRSIGGIRSLAFSGDGQLLAAGGIGQVGNVDGLAGPAHVEVWDWQRPELKFVARADDHKALVEQLIFHPGGEYLIGAGGGSDNALVAFWKLHPLPPAPPKDPKEREKAPPTPVVKHKLEGHIHRGRLRADGKQLVTAGHGSLEVFQLAE